MFQVKGRRQDEKLDNLGNFSNSQSLEIDNAISSGNK